MSEPDDNKPRRQPPTIDLTAREIHSDPPGGSAPNSEAAGASGDAAADGGASRARHGGDLFRRAAPYAVGVVGGGVLVAAAVAALWMTDLLPAREKATQVAAPSAMPSAVAPPATQSAATDDIAARLDRIQQSLQAPHPDAALAGRATAADAQIKALGDSVVALSRRVDEVAGASQAALAQAKAATAAAADARNDARSANSAAGASVSRGDVEALASRIAALETAIRSLSADVAQRTSSADDRTTRTIVAAEALRATVERGAPYQAELAAVQSLGIGGNATAALEPFAAGGIPSAAALGRELAALVPALRRAAAAGPGDTSFLGRLENHMQELVRVTPLDASANAAGNDVASALARLTGDAARDDIDAALADIARLPDAARAQAQDWVKRAQARAAAIAASRRIAAEALAAVGKPAAQ
jgi:hypothetical protein